MKKIFAVVCIFLLTFYFTKSTPVNTCSDDILLPEVEVGNCEQLPCVFYTGSNATFSMKFRAPHYLDNIAPAVFALAAGLNISYPLDQKDACEGITNTPCPIVENEKVEYSFAFFILSFFPETSLTLQFNIMDLNTNEPVCCFKVDGQVKKS